MDKMLTDGMGDIAITNDGATILKQMDIEHHAAKMMVEFAKTQDDEVGDGTTSAVIIWYRAFLYQQVLEVLFYVTTTRTRKKSPGPAASPRVAARAGQGTSQ